MTDTEYSSWPLEAGAPADGHAFIQWKNTDVCIELECPTCSRHLHYDGMFASAIQCPKCDTIVEMTAKIAWRQVFRTAYPTQIAKADD